jgi:hypothetical protein
VSYTSDVANDQIELEQNIVDGARASLTYSYARASETVGQAAITAYVDECLKGVGKDYNKQMLETFPVSLIVSVMRC